MVGEASDFQCNIDLVSRLDVHIPVFPVARFSNVRRASPPFYRKFNLPAAPKGRSHCQIAARARELKRNKSGFKRIARTMRAVSLSYPSDLSVSSFEALLSRSNSDFQDSITTGLSNRPYEWTAMISMQIRIPFFFLRI